MSSATSISSSTARSKGLRTTADADESKDAASFRPWQFFLLAGMLAATAAVVVATGQSPASIITLSLTVVAASFVGLGVYRSLVPLVLPESVETPTLIGGRTRAALEREKTLVLRSIKELEFDYAMKKVAKADFEEMQSRLRARALGLMRQLDQSGGYRADIERELKVRLARVGGGAGGAGLTASPKATAVEKSRGIAPAEDTPRDTRDTAADSPACAACGTTNDADAKFCKNCGTKMGA